MFAEGPGALHTWYKMKKMVPWERYLEKSLPKGRGSCPLPPQHLLPQGFGRDQGREGIAPALQPLWLQARLPVRDQHLTLTHGTEDSQTGPKPNSDAPLFLPLREMEFKEAWEVPFIFNRMSFPTGRQYIFFPVSWYPSGLGHLRSLINSNYTKTLFVFLLVTLRGRQMLLERKFSMIFIV